MSALFMMHFTLKSTSHYERDANARSRERRKKSEETEISFAVLCIFVKEDAFFCRDKRFFRDDSIIGITERRNGFHQN